MSNGDIMGGVNSVLETMNSGVAMFINGDAGDISPGELGSSHCSLYFTIYVYTVCSILCNFIVTNFLSLKNIAI